MQSPHTGKNIHLPITELVKNIPEFFGIRLHEEPKYEVISKDGDLEIRNYEPQMAISVTGTGEFKEFQKDAFLRLAAFIFGENKDKTKIAMTTPVLQEHTGKGWTMTFILPKKFIDTLPPQALDPSIQVKSLDARTVATLRYGGDNTYERMLAKRTELAELLTSRNDLQVVGDPWWAQYDADFVLSVAKRNEIQCEVRKLN